MKENARTAMTMISFMIFLLIVSGSSDYLIKIVPAPHKAALDLYSIVHAFAVAGTVIFILIFTKNKIKFRNHAFLALLVLIFAWEIIENTVLTETALAGQESLENIGADILIGVLSLGIVLSAQNGFFYSNPTKKDSASKTDPT